MKKILSLVLALCMMLMGAVAFADDLTPVYAEMGTEIVYQSADDLPEVAAAKEYKIGLALTTVGTSWFKKLSDSATNALEAAGCKVLPVVCEENVETEVGQLENLMAQGVDAIIVNPCNPTEALIPIMEELAMEGIPVLTIDNTPSEEAPYLSSISVDAYKLGFGVGSYLATQLLEMYPDETEIKYALIGGIDGDAIAAARNKGAREGVKDVDKEGKIVEASYLFSGGYSEEVGLQTAQNMLTANPDLKCIIGTCDAHVLGASQAMTALGMDDVRIIMGAVDGSEEAMDSIVNGGNIVCTGMNDAVAIGKMAARMIVSYLNDGTMPASRTIKLTPAVCSIENVNEYLAQ